MQGLMPEGAVTETVAPDFAPRPSAPLSKIRLASPELRDKFLTALDTHDDASLRDVAIYLVGCTNPLPSSTCVLLGLKPGSTYGDGAAALALLRAATVP